MHSGTLLQTLTEKQINKQTKRAHANNQTNKTNTNKQTQKTNEPQTNTDTPNHVTIQPHNYTNNFSKTSARRYARKRLNKEKPNTRTSNKLNKKSFLIITNKKIKHKITIK